MLRPKESATFHPPKVCEIPPASPIKRRLFPLLEMVVPISVNCLIRRHALPEHLLGLDEQQRQPPPSVGERLQRHVRHERLLRREFADVRGVGGPYDVAAVDGEEGHEGEGGEEGDEVAVVAEADAVAHPGAVVIKAGHAKVADGTML